MRRTNTIFQERQNELVHCPSDETLNKENDQLMEEVLKNLKNKEDLSGQISNLQLLENVNNILDLVSPKLTTLRDMHENKSGGRTKDLSFESTMQMSLKSPNRNEKLEDPQKLSVVNSIQFNQSIMEDVLHNLEQNNSNRDLTSVDLTPDSTPLQKKRLKLILNVKENLYENCQNLSLNNSHRASLVRNKK